MIKNKDKDHNVMIYFSEAVLYSAGGCTLYFQAAVSYHRQSTFYSIRSKMCTYFRLPYKKDVKRSTHGTRIVGCRITYYLGQK